MENVPEFLREGKGRGQAACKSATSSIEDLLILGEGMERNGLVAFVALAQCVGRLCVGVQDGHYHWFEGVAVLRSGDAAGKCHRTLAVRSFALRVGSHDGEIG